MGIKNFFTNEKAIIEIFDARQIAAAAKKTIPGSNAKEVPRTIRDTSIMDDFKKTLGGNQLDMLNSMLDGKELVRPDLLRLDVMKKQFEVQFNPSDLQIEGYGGGRIAATTYNTSDPNDKSKPGVVMIPMPVYIKMSVKLLFDRMDPSDSFLSAKTNIAASDIGRSVAKNAVKASGLSRKLTVQQEVEGLIAALRSEYTRSIIFNWGDMSYEGVLNRVASQYTMFNSSGEPVRAVVQLSLVCADKDLSPSSLGAWQDAYETAFGKGSKSLVGVGQKVGSILNIGK